MVVYRVEAGVHADAAYGLKKSKRMYVWVYDLPVTVAHGLKENE